MIDATDWLFAGVACGALSLLAFACLELVRSKSAARVRQLNEAAALLNTHAECLERLLSDPAVPDALKDSLAKFGDSIADRATVGRMATWLADRPFGEPVASQSADELAALVDDLTRDRRDLADGFVTAVVTGAFGACLRWPETAALFEQITSKMAATPRRDVAVAATVGSLRHTIQRSRVQAASVPA
jgi:hypothetical protein